MTHVIAHCLLNAARVAYQVELANAHTTHVLGQLSANRAHNDNCHLYWAAILQLRDALERS